MAKHMPLFFFLQHLFLIGHLFNFSLIQEPPKHLILRVTITEKSYVTYLLCARRGVGPMIHEQPIRITNREIRNTFQYGWRFQ